MIAGGSVQRALVIAGVGTVGVGVAVVAVVFASGGGRSVERPSDPVEVRVPSAERVGEGVETEVDVAASREREALRERVGALRRLASAPGGAMDGARHSDAAVQGRIDQVLGRELTLDGLDVDVPPGELATRIDERVYLVGKELGPVTDQLQDEIEGGTEEEAAQALRVLAAIEEDLAGDIADAPAPGGMGAEEQRAYREALDDLAQVRRARAEAYLERAADLLGEGDED